MSSESSFVGGFGVGFVAVAAVGWLVLKANKRAIRNNLINRIGSQALGEINRIESGNDPALRFVSTLLNLAPQERQRLAYDVIAVGVTDGILDSVGV